MIQQLEWRCVKRDIPYENERVLIRCDGIVPKINSLKYSFGTISRPWGMDSGKYHADFLIICTEYDQKEHDVRRNEQDVWFWARLE
jgi:hypothetical protein